MFSKLFKKQEDKKWITSMQKGFMLRECKFTGKVEYRDCKRQVWVPLKNKAALQDLISHRDSFSLTDDYAVEGDA